MLFIIQRAFHTFCDFCPFNKKYFFAEFVAAVPDRGAVYVEIAGDFAVPHLAEIAVENGFFAFGQAHFADDFVRL